MTASANVNDRSLARTQGTSVQTYARIAAILFLLTAIGGGLGQAYIPFDLSIRLLAESSRRSARARWCRVCREELRAGACAEVRIRCLRAAYVCCRHIVDAVAVREGRRCCKMGREDGLFVVVR